MIAKEIITFLSAYDLMPLRLKLAYADLTEGKTTEGYIVTGLKSEFRSIHEFIAQGLIAIDQHMTGAQLKPYPEEYWASLEANPCEPEAWMTRYDATLNPRDFPGFAAIQAQGLELPSKVEKRFYLLPHLKTIEECVVCQDAKIYVLLYWYTTG